MIECVILLFLFILFLSIFTSRINIVNTVSYCIAFVGCVLIAGFKPLYSDKDSVMYEEAWYHATYDSPIEGSFVFFKNLLKNNLDFRVQSIFVFYALVGVGIKFIAIRRLTNLIFLTLLVYVSHFYILHDLTQIRAAVASGFFLLALPEIYKKNWKKYFFLIICAMIFHYSAFFLFFLYFLNPFKSQKIFLYIIPLGYVVYFIGGNVIIDIPIPYFQQKLNLYKDAVESGDKQSSTINVFNAFILLKIAMFYLLYICKNKFSDENKYSNLLLKIEAISLASLPFLAVIPAIAYRIHELFGIVEIILIPLAIYIFKHKFIGYILVMIYALTFLLVNIFYNELIINPPY